MEYESWQSLELELEIQLIMRKMKKITLTGFVGYLFLLYFSAIVFITLTLKKISSIILK